MLKIVESRNAAAGALLSLEGRLVAPWTAELVRIAGNILASGPLALDVAAVSFVDRDSIAALRELAGRGARVERCNPFLQTLLKDLCSSSGPSQEITK